MTPTFYHVKIFFVFKIPFFATDGIVEYHGETKNAFADRLGAGTHYGFLRPFVFDLEEYYEKGWYYYGK